MANLVNELTLGRCPHCGIAHPHLEKSGGPFQTQTHSGGNPRFWAHYTCSTCGGVVLASAVSKVGTVKEMFPSAQEVQDAVKGRAKQFLTQALASKHAPAGAIMLAASAVDAMLKDKNYKDDSLYKRIDQAAADHLITEDMAVWAHEVRLDANDQRHADEAAPLPNEADAQRCIDFALALAEFLYVLPSRVQRGLADATSPD